MRSAKKEYFCNQFKPHKKDLKSTWKIINFALNNNPAKTRIPEIRAQDDTTQDPVQIAEYLNDYFVGVGPTLAGAIPPSRKNFHSFLKNPNPKFIFFAPVQETEIINIVNNLLLKKSPGYDGITNSILKHVILEIAIPLTHIFNLSLINGVVPSHMKKAKVIPIYKKKGETRDRPISLLTTFSKILGKIIYTRTIKFLTKCDFWLPIRFSQKHATHAMLIFINKVAKAIDDYSHAIGIFLDFSKAFDTINHEILLYKLSHYGVRGKALEWFRNYLQDRTKYVSVNNCESTVRHITCGVPQGSLLGPLLFILYINDLKSASAILSLILFADETNIFLSHCNPQRLLDTVNSELILIYEWIQANKLSLNINKTNYMLFSNIIDSLPGEVFINGVALDCVQSYKISWNIHWQQIIVENTHRYALQTCFAKHWCYKYI